MTAEPRWWSQPFPPTGAITSEGIRNQLGRPPVDPLTVFVRETVQNSWDARLPGRPVGYHLELSRVSVAHRPDWDRLLAPPSDIAPHLPLAQALRKPDLTVLSVIDRGTVGLGGPTRADESADARRDWVSFVLNVGEKRDTNQGGGTYGYGKAVLYRLSTVGTVLVHSRIADAGRLRSRLIGIALGESFETMPSRGSRPYTGRHWWGDVQDEHVEPLLDDRADAVARSLGLRPFAPGETGTTLAVVAPDLDDLEVEGVQGGAAAARHLAETIAWHAWPLMLPDRGEERLLPRVTVHGQEAPVMDPASAYPLRMFVSAYRRAKSSQGEQLMCLNPRRRLGRFALERTVVLPMPEEEGTAAAAYADVPRDPHHVCLMRSPELVVRYLEGPKPFSTNIAYAGVFRADDDLDEVFAAAEPPTHDSWVFEQLQGEHRTFVRVLFRRLKERLSEFRRAFVETGTRPGVPLGAAGNFLGGLIAAAYSMRSTDGAHKVGASTAGGDLDGDAQDAREFDLPGSHGSVAADGRQPTTRPTRGRVAAVGEARLLEIDGEVVIVQDVEVSGSEPVELYGRLSVITAVGREDEPPTGVPGPSVHSWVTPGGIEAQDTCVVVPPARVTMRVRPAPDTVTDLRVEGRPVGSPG